ncbi:hypothetical protein CRI94_03675 [Longibacter salinarum]|uniref:Endonuclease/exonuclease/phosphatase domain-containing protein n=1 Tax=Longibacter salinarum TaxID=1850348 RepID=A0A2A8CZX4_9BACT|nr:endonuclease/exonuclease/phosphatase family protein [Longibacter salinarum]PEN14151.1 hypothetical protein CRI94_03675 [Longibacter salinarum]
MPTEVDIRRASTLGAAVEFALRAVRRGAFLLVTIVLLGLFLLGYATAYLPPSHFWWTSPFAVLLPYVSILLAPLAFVRMVAAIRGRELVGFMLSIAVLVMIAGRFGPVLFSDPKTAHEDDLTITSFNAPTHGPSRAKLANAFVSVVDAVEPDMLALQETNAYVRTENGPLFERRTAPHLYELVQNRPFRLPDSFPPGHRIPQPVVSRFRTDSLTLVGEHDPIDRTRIAPASRVTFTWKGQPLVLYNLHLYTVSKRKPWRESGFQWLSPGTWGPYLAAYREATLRRAEEARAIRSEMEKETVPVIVAGDFNSTVHHWEYRHIARGMQNVMHDAGTGWPATYPSRSPLVGIDHVLADPEIVVVSGTVGESYPYTDHRPVHARLRVRPIEDATTR